MILIPHLPSPPSLPDIPDAISASVHPSVTRIWEPSMWNTTNPCLSCCPYHGCCSYPAIMPWWHLTDTSPTVGRLSVVCRPTVGWLIVYVLGKTCRPSVGRQTANSRPTDSRQSANSRPTDSRQSANRRPTVGQQSADRRPTVGQQTADSWPTVGRQVFWGAPLHNYRESSHFSRPSFGFHRCLIKILGEPVVPWFKSCLIYWHWYKDSPSHWTDAPTCNSCCVSSKCAGHRWRWRHKCTDRQCTICRATRQMVLVIISKFDGSD